jgi:hypothetical protein
VEIIESWTGGKNDSPKRAIFVVSGDLALVEEDFGGVGSRTNANSASQIESFIPSLKRARTELARKGVGEDARFGKVEGMARGEGSFYSYFSGD